MPALTSTMPSRESAEESSKDLVTNAVLRAELAEMKADHPH